ncbi:MAG: hypothetical protein KJ749_02485, partial [Planctomycetes bacterium]|nr:hypothetical protein [Planctomycetota bacterium]
MTVLDYELPEHLRARLSAKRHERGVLIIALVTAVLCFAGAGTLLDPLNTIRRERQLVIDPASLGSLPADLELIGKLGTFRALAIDWASIRAERLKEEGKTYEALQLHETVCALAPRFPKVWANAAWNMAYNISVSQYTPEARWKWLRNGISILRDKGIQYNPTSVTLYRELTWIYWHKIGGILDDEHRNYKRALAVEMERVLGPPPVTVTTDEYLAWFREIVDAPRNLEQMLVEDRGVAELAGRLAQVDLTPDSSLLDFVAENLRRELRTADLLETKTETDPRFGQRLELLEDPAQQEALRRLLAAVRSAVLRETYKFDLDWMMQLMEQYGPIDWRNTFANGLYWATYGHEKSRGRAGADFGDAVNTARLVLFALQSLIDRGRMVLFPDFDDPFESYIDLAPDTRFIPYLYDAYLRYSKELFGDDPGYVEGMPAKNYRTGFVTAMHNWIQYLYFEGGERNIDLAKNYFAWLRENNLHPDGTVQSRYLTTVDEFVMGDILNQLQTSRAASGLVRSLCSRALKHFALGQIQSGVTALRRAKSCHQFWNKGPDIARTDRILLQPLPVILRDQIVEYMQLPQFDPLFKARLWSNLPLEQRQMAYDQLRVYF